jgi:ABC-type branched-subunit amino acid transport system substrate-binding protein
MFRDQTSDTATGLAMGLYAAQKGYKTGVLMMENEPAAQGFKAPVQKAFERAGGKIIGSVDLQSSQPSYRSEVESVIAMHPDVIFTETPSAAGPMFANFKELDNLAIPIIGSDSTADPNYIKAIGGSAVAMQALTSLTGATPSGPAYNTLATLIKSMFNTTPGGNAPDTYDAVLMIALAMDAAKSTDGTAVAKEISTIADPPGTQCYDYPSCLHLLNQGQKINFEGAGGDCNFDQYHNVFTDYVAVKVDSTGENFNTVGTVTAAAVTTASK